MNFDEVLRILTEPGETTPVFTVNSLSAYCELTDWIREVWSRKAQERLEKKGYVGEILPWFRGATKSTHTLTPSLARDWEEYHKHYERIFDLEDYYYDRFTRFGRPFLGGPIPNDEIEWNYIMRHHDIPSRLLDWTKGSLIALSYATKCFTANNPTTDEFSDNGSKPHNAAVWMLEPRRLMETATKTLYPKPIRNIASRRIRVKGMRRDFFRDTTLGEEFLVHQFTKPKSIHKWRTGALSENALSNPDLWHASEYWKYPLPLIPSHISARVGSHLSRFTLHSLEPYTKRNLTPRNPPKEDNGMSSFALNAFNDDKCWYLIKIELLGEQLRAISRVLRMTGVADMSLTQDLDGLARELRLRAKLGLEDDKR